MGAIITLYINYLKEHTLQGTFGSIGAIILSYLDLDVHEAYEILVEVLRFVILLFGAITAVLTFYARFVKNKINTKKRQEDNE